MVFWKLSDGGEGLVICEWSISLCYSKTFILYLLRCSSGMSASSDHRVLILRRHAAQWDSWLGHSDQLEYSEGMEERFRQTDIEMTDRHTDSQTDSQTYRQTQAVHRLTSKQTNDKQTLTAGSWGEGGGLVKWYGGGGVGWVLWYDVGPGDTSLRWLACGETLGMIVDENSILMILLQQEIYRA